VLKRDDQDARRGSKAGRGEQREPGDPGHHPAVVEAPHLVIVLWSGSIRDSPTGPAAS
jgi:hypothetical protein